MGLLNYFKGKEKMPVYLVLINGRNFLLEFEGKEEKHGFFIQLFIEEADPKAAEIEAVRILKEEMELRQIAKNTKTDSPMLFAEEIEPVERTAHVNSMVGKRPGIAWYLESTGN